MNKKLFDKLNDKNIPLIYNICIGIIELVAVILLVTLPVLSFRYGSIEITSFGFFDFSDLKSELAAGAYCTLFGIVLIVVAFLILSLIPRILVRKEYSRLNWTNKKKKNQEIEKLRLYNISKQSTLWFVLCGIMFAFFLIGAIILIACGIAVTEEYATYYSSSTVTVSLSSGAIAFLVLGLICIVIDAAINIYIYISIKDLSPEESFEKSSTLNEQLEAPLEQKSEEISEQKQNLEEHFEKEIRGEMEVMQEHEDKSQEDIIQKEDLVMTEENKSEQHNAKPLQTRVSDHMKEFNELKEILDSGIILQLKELVDKEILTDEEFQTKKKDLLNI